VAGGAPRNQTEGYPFLLAVALALLIAESLISDRRLQAAALGLFLAATPRGESFQTPDLPAGTSSTPNPSTPVVDDDAGSVADWVKSGNKAFAGGHYGAAVHFYVWARETAPNSPEVLFDLALGFYKTESYREAGEAFERAAAHSRDPKFRAQCKFGQANAAYRVAMQHSTHLFDFEQALSLTIPLYRAALALDPGLTDCKYNIEVVKRKLRELTGPMRAATTRYMAQSREDLVRRHNTEASQILQENKNGKKTTGQVGRPRIDTDW
jgi:tetratricopeptide (TPR) repeat protein